jgi:hypothetical protein
MAHTHRRVAQQNPLELACKQRALLMYVHVPRLLFALVYTPPSQNTQCFLLLDILFDCPSYLKILFLINIIYFVMTYFIIRDTLLINDIYFIICTKKLNKTNDQT